MDPIWRATFFSSEWSLQQSERTVKRCDVSDNVFSHERTLQQTEEKISETIDKRAGRYVGGILLLYQ